MAHAEERHIGCFRQRGDARPALAAKHRRVIRVDRKDPTGKADPVERGDQASPDRRLVGRTDYGDRCRPKQRVELHCRSPPAGIEVPKVTTPRVSRHYAAQWPRHGSRGSTDLGYRATTSSIIPLLLPLRDQSVTRSLLK